MGVNTGSHSPSIALPLGCSWTLRAASVRTFSQAAVNRHAGQQLVVVCRHRFRRASECLLLPRPAAALLAPGVATACRRPAHRFGLPLRRTGDGPAKRLRAALGGLGLGRGNRPPPSSVGAPAARMAGRRKWPERPMHVGDRKRPPLSPREGWLSDGRQSPACRRPRLRGGADAAGPARWHLAFQGLVLVGAGMDFHRGAGAGEGPVGGVGRIPRA